MGLKFQRLISWFNRESEVSQLRDAVKVWHGRALGLETELYNMTKARDVYKRDAEKSREELHIMRLVGGNRFGGAL